MGRWRVLGWRVLGWGVLGPDTSDFKDTVVLKPEFGDEDFTQKARYCALFA